MDTKLRQLLQTAGKGGQKGSVCLDQAYGLMKNSTEKRTAVENPDVFGQDLYVICAETAFQYGKADVCRECLKLYFMKTPPTNQFLCRAYLCQAQLLAPTTADNPEQLDKAVVYLVKAINIAKENQRYHFLVYNASVIYWRFSRPFLKTRFKQYLSPSLHQVVKALDDIEDADYEWRAQLMIALIECHMDAGRKTDAMNIAGAAATFIKQNVPVLFKTVFSLMARHQLVESPKLQKDIRSSPELRIFYSICLIRQGLEQQESDRDFPEEMRNVLLMIQKPEEALLVPEERATQRQKTPVKRPKTETPDKEITITNRPYLLLELGRLALEQNVPDVGDQCVALIQEKSDTIEEPGFFLEVEFLKCDLMVRSLGDKQEAYSKSSVHIRLQALKRCEEAIQNSRRQGSPNIIQAGCVTLWNLCLPLLQSNLRQHVRRPLTTVAEALESINSLLVQLRCQIHMELARCEEDQEQIAVAMAHLKKALVLDDGQVYQERIQVALRRMELRAELYNQPERPEDQAGMIIEQARKADSGTIRMKRSLLVRAGQALAPDAFLLVLDSENETKEITQGGKKPQTLITRLAGKARQFKKGVKKAAGHLRRLGSENDRERARLWADLTKTARKQEVWDVCRVAARFCLLYDDDRWKNEVSGKEESVASKKESENLKKDLSQKSVISLQKEGKERSPSPGPETPVPLSDKDLVRTMAEVQFINGEALIHLLRTEGVELGNDPIPPEDKSKRPKGYVPVKPEEDPEWLEYCEWIAVLSTEATASFLRSTSLGVQLGEPWICCCAATYMWNYNNHMLDQGRQPEIVENLTVVLDGLRTVGHAGEAALLVNVCNAIATGLIQEWAPETSRGEESPAQANKSPASPKRKGAPAPVTNTASKKSVTISADAAPALKKALEICEYGLQVTNGDNPIDLVPIAVRYPLLQTWVCVKQMLQSQISKGLGAEEEGGDNGGQNEMTRAMVATEMLSLNKNGIMEFKDLMPVSQIISMVEQCQWTDRLVELQLWTKLTSLCYDVSDHALTQQCALKALEFVEAGSQTKIKQSEGHRYVVEQEMLSYASCIYGQSLAELCQGKNSIRRQAMEQFLYSARFACNASNNTLVMAAARHYWNAALPLINVALERELLMEPLSVLLECISLTSDKMVTGKEKGDNNEDALKVPKLSSLSLPDQEVEKKASEGDLPIEDDLSLRAAIYGVLFQAYADKGEWEAGLKAMDQAIADMPRTSHRLQIFKHMVIVRAKLGLNVQMSVQKFKDESEDYVAHMWRRVALCSKDQMEQLQAYQNAVEALSKQESDWQKIDYLVEFGQWLYCNNFPLEDALDQIEWACDILLNMKFEVEQKAEAKDKGKKSSKKKASANPVKSSKKNVVEEPESKVAILAKAENKTDGQKSEADGGEFVPVKKDVFIGVLPNNPGLSVADLIDVRQLDTLFQAATIQAQISGRSSVDHLGYCLVAFGYIMRIWQISLGSCGSVVKELAKNPTSQDNNNNGGKTSAKGKKKDKDATAPPQKEKPKHKGLVDAVPATIEEWASYDTPDEVLEAFKNEAMMSTGINANTITKPAMTLHYLDVLTKLLRENGYNHLVLPLLAFEDVLSRGLLRSRLLGALVHLRSMEACLELNLLEGALYHENLTELNIDVSDQTRSREEITLWREKQAQVAKEEVRLQGSMSRLSKSLSGKKKSNPGDKSMAGKMSEDATVNHLGKRIGAVQMREVWTDMAEVLLQHAMYQPAREMLSEAHQAATAFDDKPLLARILYLFGKLAFYEGQFGQASNFGHLAQETHEGDEMFWYETTKLIVEATEHNYVVKNHLVQARTVLDGALKIFEEVALLRPNKSCITGFIIAQMEAKLGFLEIKINTNKKDLLSKAKFVSAILSSSKKIRRSEEQLIKLGYGREAVSLHKERIHILNELAREADTIDEKHDFYLQCVRLFKEEQFLADGIMYNIQTSSPVMELHHISLPVQRESIEIKLLCSELMLEIFQLMTSEDCKKQLAALRKGSLLVAVEELAEAREYSPVEKDWMTAKDVLGDVILTMLSNVHGQVGSLPQLKARCLHNVGHCLNLLSEGINPDRAAQWSLNDMGLSVVTEQEDDNEEEVKTTTERQDSRYRIAMAKNVKNLQTSSQYLMQATECLTQAVNLALSKGHLKLAGMAALELAGSLGQYDPGLASQYLALHQSCEASMYLGDLMKVALIDPTKSQPASLIYQKTNLLKTDVTTNASQGPVLRHVELSLQQMSQAWRRIKVSANHLDILKDFPPNFVFVVIQHTPDKNHLHGAVLDRPRNTTTQATSKAGKGNVTQALSKAKVVRCDTSPEQLESLLSRFRQFKKDSAQKVLTEEYQRCQHALRVKMLANLDESKSAQTHQVASNDLGLEDEEMILQQEFTELLSVMEDYLSPVTQMLESSLRPSSETMSNERTEKKEKGESNSSQPVQDYVVLLVDPYLMELPLEALAVLQGDHIASVSREISLQMLHHKWYQEVVADESNDKAKKDKEKTKPPSRIPGMRDASRKQSKIIPLDRPVAQGFMPVETHAFKYIVDPHLDCSETEDKKPIEIFEDVLEEHSMQFTPRWLGVPGNDHTPSAGEYEIYMQESSAFIFYGMERLACFIPPYKIASMNLLECNMVMLFDRMQTNKSFLRQSKVDILKTTDMLRLEQPIETAMLLSLTGVRSVIANQWNCSLAENAARVQDSLKDFLAGGIANGQVVRLLHLPHRRKKEEAEDAGKAAEEPPQDVEEDDKEKEPAENSSLAVARDSFNMVCYGLPNLIVTQLTKL